MRRSFKLLIFLMFLIAGTSGVSASHDTVKVDGTDDSPPREGVMTGQALQALVAPIALYPDALLAVVLAACAYPNQVFEAADFLDADGQHPNSQWDDAVVALLNYPGVLARMNEDREWTRRLGALVRYDREQLLDAVAEFREVAFLVGNLVSNDRQYVERVDGVVTITSADPEVMYVPRYEPWEVSRRQPVTRTSQIVYYDHRPVYYYPYPAHHRFVDGRYWGVATAYGLGWHRRELHMHPYWYRQHPYFGRRYHFDDHYYRYSTARYWPPYTDRYQPTAVWAWPSHYFSWHYLHHTGPWNGRQRKHRRDRHPDPVVAAKPRRKQFDDGEKATGRTFTHARKASGQPGFARMRNVQESREVRRVPVLGLRGPTFSTCSGTTRYPPYGCSSRWRSSAGRIPRWASRSG
ncbi:MAG: DUF3300 domain-containing protein [Pseudomonadales bacterium]|nr:DUF3300 domain-containing protein [Pseudomonadales bacterium]MDP6470044.1 DUF3300 domain-containing protein [Pseudomonadales bacterium]MDP6826947.1 DUF3300 domain-containing protein [Pseudomonadales bacterium]MDP6971042.1 DUF3300 domain-containing protein [Pseudomonadales bacterium]